MEAQNNIYRLAERIAIEDHDETCVGDNSSTHTARTSSTYQDGNEGDNESAMDEDDATVATDATLDDDATDVTNDDNDDGDDDATVATNATDATNATEDDSVHSNSQQTSAEEVSESQKKRAMVIAKAMLEISKAQKKNGGGGSRKNIRGLCCPNKAAFGIFAKDKRKKNADQAAAAMPNSSPEECCDESGNSV